MPQDNQTSAISSPVGFSTELVQRRIAENADTAPTGSPQKVSTSVNKGIVDIIIEKGREDTEINNRRRKRDTQIE